MEFVLDEDADLSRVALAQRDIGDDLRRCTDDRGLAVDRRIARHHAHVLCAKRGDELKELLRDEGLKRRRVVSGLAEREARKDCGEGHHRFPRAGWRGDNQVIALKCAEQSLFLVWVEGAVCRFRPRNELLVHGVLGRRVAVLILQTIERKVERRLRGLTCKLFGGRLMGIGGGHSSRVPHSDRWGGAHNVWDLASLGFGAVCWRCKALAGASRTEC